MLLEVLLNLRRGRERCAVIQREGHTRPELGIAHPQEDERRVSLPGMWGWEQHPTRAEPTPTIDEPLDTRSQTILSYQLPGQVRAVILRRETTPAASRLESVALKFKL